MRLSTDERRALAFIAALVLLSAIGRLLDRPVPVTDAPPAGDLAALEAASRAELRRSKAPDPKELAPGEKLDPNAASVAELRRLPRATRALAERIVADRRARGRYATVWDLDRVPGIGPATVELWTPLLKLPKGSSPAADGGRTGQGARATAATESPPRPTPDRKIHLNGATAAELEMLPEVGPALAARIVAYRDSAGPFRTLDALDGVKGIGPSILARIKPLLDLGT